VPKGTKPALWHKKQRFGRCAIYIIIGITHLVNQKRALKAIFCVFLLILPLPICSKRLTFVQNSYKIIQIAPWSVLFT
jgi:hypothetical protein